jgi:ArsR family transcriptional regulator, arsenate/arsenite/antimonite-responsive transcriptional repressor
MTKALLESPISTTGLALAGLPAAGPATAKSDACCGPAAVTPVQSTACGPAATSALFSSADLRPSALTARGFHALSDPIRLQAIDLLRRQELCVCDLTSAINISQSKLSFHLKVLREAQLVRTRQEGRWIYYSLNEPQFVLLEQYLSGLRLGETLPTRLC